MAFSLLTAPSAAASGHSGASRCAQTAADFINAPRPNADPTFVISSPLTNATTRVASVRFLTGGTVQITAVDSTYTVVGGQWEFEAGGRNGRKTAGTLNFATLITDSTGNTYTTLFAVTDPVCQKGSDRVVQLRGIFTIATTSPAGQELRGLPGAYSASR
uniref:Uncharacterized protein n=1 Tax=Streptomyces sp. NBC_00049 TaxID=2903617 RepID=A0AAU2JZZ7_9ACTN